MKNDGKISIILVNWNGLKDTLKCLDSLTKLNYINYEIILVDNGSSDDSVKVIKEKFPDIHLIETKKNLGFAGGNNVGIKKALENKSDYVFLLNNDTVVDKNICMNFVSFIKNNKKAGILGARIYKMDSEDYIDHQGGKWNAEKAEFDSYNSKSIDNLQDNKQVDYVTGCAFFIKKEVVDKIGFLEENFFLMWEETDYCYRAKNFGFEIWAIPSAIVWHKVSSSFIGGKPHTHYYWWRNRLLWINRNLSKNEKKYLFKTVLLKEMAHIFKLNMIKSLEYYFIKHSKSKNIEEKKLKLLCYKAGCRGILDYYFKNFGEGPSWLISPNNKK